MKRLLHILLTLFVLSVQAATPPADERSSVDVYVFWSKGCPHCEKALSFLDSLPARHPGLQIHRHEISEDENLQALIRVARHHQIKDVGVPVILIGDEIQIGYADDRSTGALLLQRIERCQINACKTSLDGPPASSAPAPGAPAKPPASIRLPVLGDVDLRQLSLPVLTISLAAADGFNPCAMWVLVFLIGLLLGMKNRARRWLLGSAFIGASAFVYFLIMAAWLNTLLWLGAVLWLRVALALVALVVGAAALRDFWRNETVCKVSAAPARRAVLERLRKMAQSSSLLWALIGIVLLAFAVNVVELLCSAGIPAVFTQYLAASQLAPWQHYAYLGLYILVFMADDLLIFIAAMLALDISQPGASYTRWSRLLGGCVMITLGLLMLFKPEWLT